MTAHIVSSDAFRQPPIQFISAARRFLQPKLLNFSLRKSIKAREKLFR